jgi:hypothetical protein
VFYSLLDMVKNLARRIGIRFSVEPHPRPMSAPHRPHRNTGNGELTESAGRYAREG